MCHVHSELTYKANMAGIPHAFVIGADNKVLYSGHPAKPEFEQALKVTVVSPFLVAALINVILNHHCK